MTTFSATYADAVRHRRARRRSRSSRSGLSKGTSLVASGNDIMIHSPLVLRPDPERTVLRPFEPTDPKGFENPERPRGQRIIDRIAGLPDDAFGRELDRVMHGLSERHRDVEQTVLRQFDKMKAQGLCDGIGGDRAKLVGAYFLAEYAFEAAALFNPSMVRFHDQTNLPAGGVRFVLTLRGIGEGHLSSVTVRVGTWDPAGGFAVETPSGLAIAPRIEHGNDGDDVIRIVCDGSTGPSETVLFPVTAAQQRGIEDMRLVHFHEDDGSVRYLGTYTAVGGTEACSELMEVGDFRTFTLRRMTGAAAKSKGMALFPRRLDGQFAMLGRQDNENLWLLRSDSLTHWEGGERILCPKYFWEFVQIGNCGSPIEIDEGWLVLTHGVGSVRNYCIGAALLDKADPRKVLARTSLPLVHPSPKERDGYVPNVVYSCGALVHDRTLLLPYGVADNFTAFAHTRLDDVLAVMR